jgi:hypothetical protein
MEDMTQGELLSAIADEGDMNRVFGKTKSHLQGSPRSWKFEGRLQELLDAYSQCSQQAGHLAGLCGAHLGQMQCRVGRRWYRSGSGGS